MKSEASLENKVNIQWIPFRCNVKIISSMPGACQQDNSLSAVGVLPNISLHIVQVCAFYILPSVQILSSVLRFGLFEGEKNAIILQRPIYSPAIDLLQSQMQTVTERLSITIHYCFFLCLLLYSSSYLEGNHRTGQIPFLAHSKWLHLLPSNCTTFTPSL